jgi:small subunit ribosomal protein S2
MVSNGLNLQLQDLVKIGSHLGHNKKYYNSTMASNILGHRGGVDIINLEKTIYALRNISKLIEHLILRKGNILFINTSALFDSLLIASTKISKQSYLNHAWVNGALTNFSMVKSFFKNKKVSSIEKLPDMIFLLNVTKNFKIVNEINAVGIPMFALADTDVNVKKITYPIPANDDSFSVVYFFLMYFSICLRFFCKDLVQNWEQPVFSNTLKKVVKKRYIILKKKNDNRFKISFKIKKKN